MLPLIAEAVVIEATPGGFAVLGALLCLGAVLAGAVHGWMTARAIDRSSAVTKANTDVLQDLKTAIVVLAARRD